MIHVHEAQSGVHTFNLKKKSNINKIEVEEGGVKPKY